MKKITNELIQKFKTYLIEEEKSDSTLEKYIRDITIFMNWLGETEITKAKVLEYKKELIENYAPASVNSILSSLNSFFTYNEWHECKIKTLKIQRQIFANKDRELTKAEYERLLKAALNKKNKRLYYLIQTICSSGLSDIGYTTSDTMMMVFKNVINMNYSGDISNKVKSVVHNKMKLGEYIPSKFPFGYKKEHKNGKTICVIDEQAAEVVKFIFRLCHDGTGSFKIAGMLNDNNIFNDCGVEEWNRYKVEQILKNPFYIGDYICNKANRILFQKKTQKLPSEEWITIKNHHEAIISEELFYEVQEKLKRNNSFKCDNRKQNYKYYHNDLYCGDCGRKMKRRVWNGNTYFVCPKYDYAKGLCSLKSIRDDRLKEKIFKIIKEHISELIFQNDRNSNHIKQTEIHNYVNSILENVIKKKKALQMHQQNILEVIFY